MTRREQFVGGYGDAIEINPYFTRGGQGKFFPDQKPKPEHRYPRGYTPERMGEVRGADLHFESLHEMPEIYGGEKEGAFGGPAGARRMAETVARSTMPLEDFHLLPSPVNVFGATPAMSALGVFRGPEEIGQPGLRTVHVREAPRSSEEAQGQTLIHELGHARSNIQRLEHADYKTPHQQGREEAFADEHMFEHWRPDPRDVKAGRSKPPQSAYEDPLVFRMGRGTIEGIQASGAYRATRQTPLKGQGTSEEPGISFSVRERRRAQESAKKALTASALAMHGSRITAEMPKPEEVHHRQGQLFVRKPMYGWVPNESAASIFNDRREDKVPTGPVSLPASYTQGQMF
jgi:hypothetical protein